MAEPLTLERRVAELEKQVNQLTETVFHGTKKPGWVQNLVGSMKNDPAFAETLKLGQEIRRSEQED